MDNAEPCLRFGLEVVSGGSVRLHYATAGVGPAVVLLHGFPEFWYSWRHQLPALAAAGFRAIAPDMRGYHRSDKPRGVRNYAIDVLVGDIAGLIEQVGEGRAVVVGHDWGGVVAWHLAIQRPALVERLVILNAPHPVAIRRAFRDLGQWWRSLYVLFFQLPWLPERVLAMGDGALQRRAFAQTPSWAFTADDLRRYREAFAKPADWTGPLNYYRAGFRYPPVWRERVVIEIPTLLIWGERDPYLRPRLAEGLEPWVPNLRIERLPDVGHWVQNEAADRVNEVMVGFLRQ